MSSKEARKVEGWKNTAMEKLEELAREKGCNEMLITPGEVHAKTNQNPTRPIHVEILETYGRLPMQHGFELKHLTPENHLRIEGLWWVKKL